MRQFADFAAQFADFVVTLQQILRSVLKITLGIIALQKKLDIHRALEYYIISGLYYSDTRSLNAPKAITEPEFGNPVSS